MPLYIRDEGVNDLADRLASLMGTSKTDAVRSALDLAFQAQAARQSLAQRVAPIQARAAAAGFVSTGTDLKPFFDEHWGDG